MVISGCTDAGCPLVQDNIQRLAVTLYTELLSRLVSLINRYSAVQYSTVQYNAMQYITRSIQPYHKHAAAVILFDSPGFQNPNSIGEEEDCHAISSHHYVYCIVSQESSLPPALSICATIICKNASRSCS